ncbi:MAG: glycosyl hydrolase 53 family protein [Succinivibrio sp.]|nr:glycosyl hydrolase 53 family protein [Succinivibrio sp.]
MSYKYSIFALSLGAVICCAALTGCGKESAPAASNKAAASAASSQSAPASFAVNLPEGNVQSSVFVTAVPNLPEHFLLGMDASSVQVEENSGVKYYNFKGEEQDVYQTLAEAGLNYIRLRVWNNPFDEQGHGYGGGNNDTATALSLGQRATRYGMQVCIDYHYSDFWADPKRQLAPKAWRELKLEDKRKALYDFTCESLSKLLEGGVNVGMVQIGNEINIGMAGESNEAKVLELLKEGSRAVRDTAKKFNRHIDVAVHYARISEVGSIEGVAAKLQKGGLDYDVFGLSYYPFWDGSMENMQQVVRTLREKFNKRVIIAETSYAFTAEDGDGFPNSLSGERESLVEGYPATVQGQASIVRDVVAAAVQAGAEGVFYWEGVWVPVGENNRQKNAPIWEKYGSGWASSFAAPYDPEDSGKFYGGCSWDNQAMFDFKGHPLESLNVFKYLRHGATAEVAALYAPDVTVQVRPGAKVELPATVRVNYNDQSVKDEQVSWDEKALAAVSTAQSGEFVVPGRTASGLETNCKVKVKVDNLLRNPSFDEPDTSMWQVSFKGANNPTDYLNKPQDAHAGDISFHFYSDSEIDFSVEQELTGLENGTYRLKAYAQGGDVATGSTMELYAVSAAGEQVAPFMVTGWVKWQNPVIDNIKVTDGKLKVGARVKCNPMGWGTLDDFELSKVD